MNTLPIILPKEMYQVGMKYNLERKSFWDKNNLIRILL